MAWSEEQRAELARKRARAASMISDPEEKKKFIAEQGETERKNRLKVSEDDYKSLDRKADDTIASEGKNYDVGARSRKILGSFKKGGKVRRTGVYLLHKNETVNPVKSKAGKKKAYKR